MIQPILARVILQVHFQQRLISDTVLEFVTSQLAVRLVGSGPADLQRDILVGPHHSESANEHEWRRDYIL